MPTEFSRGQKSPLSVITNGTDLYVGISLEPNTGWDVICFGLDADGNLTDDRYMIFYNVPESPEGSIQKLGAQSGDVESFRTTLDAVPESIATLAFCAALDGDGAARDLASGWLRIVAGGEEVLRYSFTGADFENEKAIIIGNVYRKGGVWRVAAEGQGFSGGLAALVRSFGGDVDEPAPDPAPAAVPGFAPPPPAVPGFAPPPPAPDPVLGFAPPPAAAAPPPATPPLAPPPVQPVQPPAMPPLQPPAVPPLQPPAMPPQQPPAMPPLQPPAMPPLQPPGQPSAPAAAPPLVLAPPGAPDPDAPSQARPTPPGAMVTLEKYRETRTTGRWTLQNPYLVKVTLGPEAFARRGAMVAYQGDIDFGFKGPGNLKDMFEQKMTGQKLTLMTCKGQGEVFLAQDAMNLHIVELNNTQLCVSCANVLALDSSLTTNIRRLDSPGLPGGGLYFLEVGGQGSVVVSTQGPPVTLPVQGPTYGDINSVVAWTSGMRVSITAQTRVTRSIFGGVSGETYNMQFMAMGGDHFAVVQPYEM